jgi:hypothetical protein
MLSFGSETINLIFIVIILFQRADYLPFDIVFKQYLPKVLIEKMISGNEMSYFVKSARDDYYHDVLFVLMTAISIKGIVSFFEMRLFCLLKFIR